MLARSGGGFQDAARDGLREANMHPVKWMRNLVVAGAPKARSLLAVRLENPIKTYIPCDIKRPEHDWSFLGGQT